MTKPDWGHGPNEPVQMYVEEQIRWALAQFLPPGSDETIESILGHLRNSPQEPGLSP